MRPHRRSGLLLLLVALAPAAGAQESPRAASASLAGYAQAWSAHDLERIAAHFTDDAVYEDVALGEVRRGRAAIRDFARGTFDALPGFAMEQRSLHRGPGWATLEWVMGGTDRATGRRFAVRGVSVMELEGGRIRRNTDYWNMADLQRQIGAPSPAPGAATPHVPASPDTGSTAARVDSIFAPFARPDSPGCAVGVFRAGEILFARGYGMASIEHGGAITPRTPFNVASLSKQFTGFAIQLLARRGRLSLDDDVRRHLPDFPDVGATVTIRHLLTHTSGPRAYEMLLTLTGWNRDHPLSREQALDAIRRQRSLGFAPGERHQYGNSNYVLLAEIVERASGRPIDRFLAEEVFAPLGMADTRLRTDPLAVIPGRAETYWPRTGGGFRRNHVWAFAHATDASNVVTTVEDLARWDREFHDERVGGPGMVAAMYRPAPLLSGDSTEYASGLGVGVYRGLPIVSHTGGAGGDYVLLRFPRQRLTTVALCNFEGGDAAGRAYRVAELFLGDALAHAPAASVAGAVTLPESALTRFVGEYRHPTDLEQRLRIEVRDGTLGALVGGVFHPAVPTGPRSFRDGPLAFEFTEPVAGTPTTLTFARPGLRGTLVQHIEPPWRPDASDLAAFAGSYRSAELDVEWTFAVRDGRLVVRRPRFPERAVATGDRDGFRLEDPLEDETVVIHLAFTRDAAGRVTGFRLDTDRVTNLAFERVAPRDPSR